MKTLKSDFMNILGDRRIKTVFQPIISLRTGETIGYEALSRIVNPREIRSSEELFYLAGIYGKIWELEQLCREETFEKYKSFHGIEHKRLFLNVNPMVIHDEEFRTGFTSEYLKRHGLDLNNIVFEVTERNAVDDIKGFKDTIRHYKAQGYDIAVDDVGSCYSGMNLICDIVPHYLKLDFSLIHGLHKDTVKYAMVKAMAEFADLTNIQLIAEGIECQEELKALLRLGVHNGQGYFLRKPDEELKGAEKPAVDIIQKYNDKKSARLKKYYPGIKKLRAVLFEMENYKAYNAYCEKYGDDQGDRIIGEMQKAVEHHLSEEEVAVMLDEDTVLAVLEKETSKIKCEKIENTFRSSMTKYYNEEELEKGYIEGKNKKGEKKEYPLLNISYERLV